MKNFVKLLLLCTIICLGCAFSLNINDVNAQTYVPDYSVTLTPPPTRYDLRDKIYIGVEKQHNFGICYAFASLTSLETYLALNYNEYYDFSEMHFAASMYLKDNYYPSIDQTLEDGGNFDHFTLYTQKDNSLVLDQVMPIDKYRLLDPSQIKDVLIDDYNTVNNNFYSIVKVNDTKSFDVIWGNKSKYTNDELTQFRTDVKNHIMQYGSVSASIYANNSFTQSTKYYCVTNDSLADSAETLRKKINHMVSVVGWDDNYDANGAWPNKGAYLCLNSWGTSFGNDGYFYISYNDYFIESSMHGVVDATLSTGKSKISTISTFENKTRIYSHVYKTEPTIYTANIIDVSNYLNKTITNIDTFAIGSGYNMHYKFFNSYNDALSGINSASDKLNISSFSKQSSYNKINLHSGLNISNNYLLLVTQIDGTCEINSLGSDALNSLNITPTYVQHYGINQFNVDTDKWSPSVPGKLLELTIPVILTLDEPYIEVPAVESLSQSVNYSNYIQNNSTYLNKLFTLKLNNTTLTNDIVNNIKITQLYNNINITSNFEITFNSNSVNFKLINSNNLLFDEAQNDCLIEIPCSNKTIYRVIEIQTVSDVFNITYHLNGGHAYNTLTYTNRHLSLTLNPAIKPGYDFIGWYTNSALTIKFDENHLPYTDLTLYAKFKMAKPTIISKSKDINTAYNGKYIPLTLIADHALVKENCYIQYQWYYAKSSTSTFEPITGAIGHTINVGDISDSGYYSCEITLVDGLGNVLSCISYTDKQTHIQVDIVKIDLTITIDNIISEEELSLEKISSKFKCVIECDFFPDNITSYEDKLNYLQLQFNLQDTSSPYIKIITAIVKDFDFYNIYIKSGQYRVIVDQLNSNNISTTAEQGFIKDCVFNVADYGINESVKQLLKTSKLNYVGSYDISYSYLDTTATVYIPLANKRLLTNLSIYMLKDNQLIKLDSVKTSEGITFNTTADDAKYILVQEKPSKLSNIDFLVLIIVVVILGTFTAYIIITKHSHSK